LYCIWCIFFYENDCHSLHNLFEPLGLRLHWIVVGWAEYTALIVDCRSSEPARCLCSKSLLKLNGRETTFNLFWSLKVSEPIRMCMFFCMGSLHLDLDFFSSVYLYYSWCIRAFAS
jgi:hypothetical protein